MLNVIKSSFTVGLKQYLKVLVLVPKTRRALCDAGGRSTIWQQELPSLQAVHPRAYDKCTERQGPAKEAKDLEHP